MKLSTLLTSIVVSAVMAAPVAASMGKTLDTVKKRGQLRCQVGTPSGGFYNLDADGNWYGLDVAVCQAVAAAIFGDKNKIEFQSVSSQQRFTALAQGKLMLTANSFNWHRNFSSFLSDLKLLVRQS